MFTDIFGGNGLNKGISALKKSLFKHRSGKIVLSNRNSEVKSAVTITDDGVNISNKSATGGIVSSNEAVTIQGVTYLSTKDKNIRKGEYSENDKTVKIFTYKETVLFESIPKEVAAQAAGQVGINISQGISGTNTSFGMDGMMPIMTDISAGPLPHIHTISMKHVHRIEPGYLYRLPSVVGFVKSCLSQLTSFLNA